MSALLWVVLVAVALVLRTRTVLRWRYNRLKRATDETFPGRVESNLVRFEGRIADRRALRAAIRAGLAQARAHWREEIEDAARLAYKLPPRPAILAPSRVTTSYGETLLTGPLAIVHASDPQACLVAAREAWNKAHVRTHERFLKVRRALVQRGGEGK